MLNTFGLSRPQDRDDRAEGARQSGDVGQGIRRHEQPQAHVQADLERFQAKWIPVRVKKTRQNKRARVVAARRSSVDGAGLGPSRGRRSRSMPQRADRQRTEAMYAGAVSECRGRDEEGPRPRHWKTRPRPTLANAGSGDGSAAAAIAASQRAWEAYREAECRGVVGRGEGSGRMVWVFGCLTEKTRERIRELETPFYQR